LLENLIEAFVITVPFASGLATATTIWTLPDAPPRRQVAMVQVTTPPASVPPAVADTKVVLAGMASVTSTPVRSRSRCCCS